MTTFFLKIVDMSLAASWMILAVLLFRLVLKKAPKWVHVLLWGIVAVRLICPISIESPVSLIPEPIGSGDMVSDWTDNYMDEVDIHTEGSFYYEAAKGAGREPIADENGSYYVVTKHDQLGEPDTVKNTVVPVLSLIWAAGMILLAFYTVLSYWRLHRSVNDAVRYRDNIYQSEYISSPFVLGLVRPRIYVSYNINSQDMEHVLSHEQAHIRRKDHWWKPLGFLLLTIHWFNPLMWLAYILLCRDIELACDEKVIKELENEQRADYMQALVSCSVSHRIAAACPLAFGEVGVKERVKSIVKYKKPGLFIMLIAIVSCFVLAACFLTDPQQEEKEKDAVMVDADSSLDAEYNIDEADASATDDQAAEMSEQDKKAAEIIYQLELSTLGKEFRDMDEADMNQILEEYGSLLEGYSFVARESVDGTTQYILGSYVEDLSENPLNNMGMLERGEGERVYQLIYELESEEVMMQEGYQETGIEIENSRLINYDNNQIILIQPMASEISLHDAMASYFWKGPEYIPDAVSRGIAVHIPAEPYLNIYLISEKYGEITETIPLTEAQAQAILEEEKVSLPEGQGLGAGLYVNGESEYYTEVGGVPQTVIDLAVERCGYRFQTPADITDEIVEARLDCIWMDEPLYAAKEDLSRLHEILTGATHEFVGGCGYSAKLTITLANGEQMIMFKGCDSCDSIVFGSYGGYFLGDQENTEFWGMFGLDAESHGMFD